jgi:hypothetical protein
MCLSFEALLRSDFSRVCGDAKLLLQYCFNFNHGYRPAALTHASAIDVVTHIAVVAI